MESHRNEPGIVAELEALRPRPRPVFIAELDERAAAGFRPREGTRAARAHRLQGLFASLSWRRFAAPAGAAALVAIAAATAVISISESGPQRPPQGPAERFADNAGASPTPPRAAPAHAREFSVPVPQESGSAGGEASVGSAGGAADQGSSVGPYAARVRQRDVERSARVVLAVDPADVRSAASEVLAVVHEFDGIVLRSSTRTRDEGRAVASFDLLVPSRRLSDSLAALSQIGPVRSRSDAAVDVTAPTIGLRERARDSRAKVEGLIAELEAATTGSERESIEAELGAERDRLARLRSRLSAMERRTHFARVSVRVVSDPGAAAAEGGSWGIDDALGDAGRILAIAAGVTVVALAVLAPIALILILALAGQRAWLRRSRERALGRSPATGEE
jgi:Domain of unknown function (DUF4349)